MAPKKTKRSSAVKKSVSKTKVSGKQIPFVGNFPIIPSLEELKFVRYGYTLPYYTKDGNDTEYLISNPSPKPVRVRLTIIDAKCRPHLKGEHVIDPWCTISILIAPLMADHYGISFLGADKPVVVNILYHYKNNRIMSAIDWAKPPRIFPAPILTSPSMYNFNYRAESPKSDPQRGSLFISNDFGPSTLTGAVYFFCHCRTYQKMQVEVGRLCTQRIDFPPKCYGLMIARLNKTAAFNILYFDSNGEQILAAEQGGKEHLVSRLLMKPILSKISG